MCEPKSQFVKKCPNKRPTNFDESDSSAKALENAINGEICDPQMALLALFNFLVPGERHYGILCTIG